jgi:hypothetical protein
VCLSTNKIFSRITNLTFQARTTVLQNKFSYPNAVKRSSNTSSTPLIILINESRLRLHSFSSFRHIPSTEKCVESNYNIYYSDSKDRYHDENAKISYPVQYLLIIYLFVLRREKREREYERDDSNDDFPICASLFSGVLVVRVQQRAFDDDE